MRPYSRMDRVQNLLKQEIAQIIDQDLRNPNLPSFITVNQVRVTKDLSQATVQVTMLEDASPETIKTTVDELNRSAGYIQRLLTQRVQLRRHPRLHFAYSPVTRQALEMERLFQQIKQEEAERPESEAPEEEDRD